MATLRVRFKLNPGRTGIALGKLSKQSENIELFLRSLASDLGENDAPHIWLAKDFKNGSLFNTVELQEVVNAESASRFNDAVQSLVKFKAGSPRRGVWLAGGFGGLALAIALIAHFVTTSREAMMRATESLVRAVATCDIAALDTALDDSCVFYYFQAPQGLGKAGILTAVTTAFAPGGQYRVGEVKIEAVQAHTRDGHTGQAQVKVFVKPDQTNFPHHSWWRLDLRKDADNTWRATAIKPLSIQGMDNAGG